MHIMPSLWMKKLEASGAPHCELGARPSSATALSLLPFSAAWGEVLVADPKGSSYLGPVACSLPACRLMGVLRMASGTWPAQHSSSVLQGREAQPTTPTAWGPMYI